MVDIESALCLGVTTRAQAPDNRRLVIPLHRGLALGSWWTGASVTADDPNRWLTDVTDFNMGADKEKQTA